MAKHRARRLLSWIFRRRSRGEQQAGMTYADLERDKAPRENQLSGALRTPTKDTIGA